MSTNNWPRDTREELKEYLETPKPAGMLDLASSWINAKRNAVTRLKGSLKRKWLLATQGWHVLYREEMEKRAANPLPKPRKLGSGSEMYRQMIKDAPVEVVRCNKDAELFLKIEKDLLELPYIDAARVGKSPTEFGTFISVAYYPDGINSTEHWMNRLKIDEPDILFAHAHYDVWIKGIKEMLNGTFADVKKQIELRKKNQWMRNK